MNWESSYVDGFYEHNATQGEYSLKIIYFPETLVSYVIKDEGVEAQKHWSNKEHQFPIFKAMQWCEEKLKELNDAGEIGRGSSGH